ERGGRQAARGRRQRRHHHRGSGGRHEDYENRGDATQVVQGPIGRCSIDSQDRDRGTGSRRGVLQQEEHSMRRFALAAICTVAVVGYVLADDFNVTITKIDGDTITATKAAKKGKKGKGKAEGVTLTA